MATKTSKRRQRGSIRPAEGKPPEVRARPLTDCPDRPFATHFDECAVPFG